MSRGGGPGPPGLLQSRTEPKLLGGFPALGSQRLCRQRLSGGESPLLPIFPWSQSELRKGSRSELLVLLSILQIDDVVPMD